MSVTIQDYSAAILKLLQLTRMNCGGSSIAAQVLLGLYNRHHFHVDLVEVACSLDDEYLNAAITAIQGRADVWAEPHTVITDGDSIFVALWRKYEHLSVSKRYSQHYGNEV